MPPPVPAASRTLRQGAEQLAAALPPLLVQAERIAATVAQGVHGRRRVGVGETFWQFRRYGSGDAAQTIDWRQSAKSQKLFVRETEWDAAETVWLWRDGSRSMRYRSGPALPSKLERANLLLLAVAALLVQGGERVAVLGGGTPPATGRVVLDRLSLLLARTPEGTEEERSLPPSAPLPRYAQVVLIGDFLSPLDEVEAAVRQLASQGVQGHLLQLLDPAEEDLPFSGRTRFEGVEGEGVLTVGRVEGLRDAYQARMQARRDSFGRLARTFNWTMTVHRTDRPPHLALLALYNALGGIGGR